MSRPVVSRCVGGRCPDTWNGCASEQAARLDGRNVVAQIAHIYPVILVKRMIDPDQLLLEVEGVAEE